MTTLWRAAMILTPTMELNLQWLRLITVYPDTHH
jgi:hypothetical protein